MKLVGRTTMQGKSTDELFQIKNCICKVAYLNGSEDLNSPPIELLEFANTTKNKSSLSKLSISEVCFNVDDIDEVYSKLKNKGIEFLSEPQYFDFTGDGFGKSKAVYFKDIDGIILELIQQIVE
ncbi:MAG: VOC family protein [bacterium]